jgi:hypothetical protein
VIATEIKKLYVSGSGNMSVANTLKTDDKINIRVTGSGNVTALVDAPDIEASVSGSGNITIKGSCKDLEAKGSGSGDIKAAELRSENAEVALTGSGTASVYASVSLDAKVSGSGSVFYSGNPKEQQIKKSGSGSVQKR